MCRGHSQGREFFEELEDFIERAVIVTRRRSLDAPLGELWKTNTVAFPHAEIVRLWVQTRSLRLRAKPTVMRPLCASARRSPRAANLSSWLQLWPTKSSSSFILTTCISLC